MPMPLSFAERQSALAEQLSKLEKSVNLKQNPLIDDEMEIDSRPRSAKRKYNEVKHLRGRESMFKRPEAPISKCLPKRMTPNYRLNPNKWTKYTLESVKPEDMSDKQNTSSAFAFLRELEERKQKVSDMEIESSKVEFQKSAIASKQLEADDDPLNAKPVFKSSTLVMPEYVIGQRKKKEKKLVPKSNEKIRELKLDHLLQDEDEDEN